MSFCNTGGHVSEELHGQLAEHFDDAEIFELGITAAVLVGMTKFLFAVDLGVQMESCPVPWLAAVDQPGTAHGPTATP
jgi:hypothetical protein